MRYDEKEEKMSRILAINLIILLPLFAQEFLEGVRVEDLELGRIEKVPIEVVKRIEEEKMDYWSEPSFLTFAYSPDSSVIAKAEKIGKERYLKIINAKTNAVKIFEIDCEHLKWSPSGKYLAFKQLEYINPSGAVEKRDCPPYFNHERLCVYNLQTHKIKSIFDLGRFSLEYYWSPTSDYLAYSALYHNSFKFAVYDAEKDTEYIIDTTFAKGGELWNFFWSPTGKMLAYTKPLEMDFNINEEVPVKSEVFLVNYDGTGKTQLTNTPQSEMFVRWLPDGQRLIVEWGDVQKAYYEPPHHYYLILKRREK